MIDKEMYEKAVSIESTNLIKNESKFSQGRKCEVILIPVLAEYYEGQDRIEYLTSSKFLSTYNTLVNKI